eukprot:SAG11_NODE_1390_length_5055_cov_2.299637_5_plen_57_part_00
MYLHVFFKIEYVYFIEGKRHRKARKAAEAPRKKFKLAKRPRRAHWRKTAAARRLQP